MDQITFLENILKADMVWAFYNQRIGWSSHNTPRSLITFNFFTLLQKTTFHSLWVSHSICKQRKKFWDSRNSSSPCGFGENNDRTILPILAGCVGPSIWITAAQGAGLSGWQIVHYWIFTLRRTCMDRTRDDFCTIAKTWGLAKREWKVTVAFLLFLSFFLSSSSSFFFVCSIGT